MAGYGTSEATALAVKLAAAGVRKLGFRGTTPHLRRDLPDGAVWLVNFQRVNSGVTGREPGFTVNLNVVIAALQRRWADTEDWRARAPLRSGADIGEHERLGALAFGQDHWWHPGSDADAERDAAEVVAQMAEHGLPWLAKRTAPTR